MADRNIVEELMEGPKSWNGFRKVHPNLKPNLSGANFTKVDLQGAVLRDANFNEANLTRANLTDAGLQRANLISAILCKTDFKGADLTNADCQLANFNGACLAEATLCNGKFISANFSNADLRHANFERADLTGAIFRDVRLDGVILKRAILSQVKFEGEVPGDVIFERANFSDVNLSGMGLSGCNFTACDFRGANLEGVDLSGADLTGANFSNANLSNANFTEVDATGADFRGADLIGAHANQILLGGKYLESAGAIVNDTTQFGIKLATGETVFGEKMASASEPDENQVEEGDGSVATNIVPLNDTRPSSVAVTSEVRAASVGALTDLREKLRGLRASDDDTPGAKNREPIPLDTEAYNLLMATVDYSLALSRQPRLSDETKGILAKLRDLLSRFRDKLVPLTATVVLIGELAEHITAAIDAITKLIGA